MGYDKFDRTIQTPTVESLAMPEPQKVLAMVQRATVLFRATPGRDGGLITLDGSAEDVMVVGDLHGNIPVFRQVLLAADLARNPKRHLVLQELVHGNKHYPDEGGDKSHQLLDIVAALKCQFPDRVHLILGNHELSELTGRPIAKAGVALNALFRQGIDTAYGPAAETVYQAYRGLFAALPLAVRTSNRVFLCHTIPDPIDLEDFDVSIFKATAWPAEAMARHGAVYSHHLGPEHRPGEHRPIRRAGRRGLVHHRPSALRRRIPPGQSSPDHH